MAEIPFPQALDGAWRQLPCNKRECADTLTIIGICYNRSKKNLQVDVDGQGKLENLALLGI